MHGRMAGWLVGWQTTSLSIDYHAVSNEVGTVCNLESWRFRDDDKHCSNWERRVPHKVKAHLQIVWKCQSIVREDSENTPKIKVAVNLSGKRNNYSSHARLPRDLDMHMGTVSTPNIPQAGEGWTHVFFCNTGAAKQDPPLSVKTRTLFDTADASCWLFVLLGSLATRYQQTWLVTIKAITKKHWITFKYRKSNHAFSFSATMLGSKDRHGLQINWFLLVRTRLGVIFGHPKPELQLPAIFLSWRAGKAHAALNEKSAN